MNGFHMPHMLICKALAAGASQNGSPKAWLGLHAWRALLLLSPDPSSSAASTPFFTCQRTLPELFFLFIIMYRTTKHKLQMQTQVERTHHLTLHSHVVTQL